ncbi:hypothetical protein JCM6882_007008 [Rhodosporidiobolus microsporus]
MSQRPPLHQVPPARPRSPALTAGRPPSPARSSLAPPFSYSQSYAPQPLYASSNALARPVFDRRNSVGGAYRPGGSYAGGVSPPSTGWYSTPVHHRTSVDYHHHQQQQPAAAFGHPAPTARRLSFASSSSAQQQPRERPASSSYLPSPPSAGRAQPLQLPTPPPVRRSSVAGASDIDMSDGNLDKRRPKTPPDCCAVCSVTETPEWRKGPAGSRSLCNGCGLVAAKRAKERETKGFAPPASAPEIEHELESIGAERFKVTNGRYRLPPNTRQRIATTQERTRQQQHPTPVPQAGRGRSRSKLVGQETKAAAASLLGLRRASVSTETPAHQYPSASAPRSPPSSVRGRRSGSLVNQHGQYASNVGPNGGGLPPSSSYMTLPQNGFGASSTFSFGRPSSSASSSSFPRPPSPAGYKLAPITSPIPRPASPARPPSSGLVRPASPSASSPPLPIAALAASTDRMSIAHLTSPRPPSPAAPSGPAGMPTHPSTTSALRRRSASVGPAPSRSSSMSRRPTT